MVTRIILIAIFSIFSLGSFAQELTCGTEPTLKDIEALNKLEVTQSAHARIAVATPTKIAITAHVVRTSDGTGGLTEQQLTDAIADVNEIYTLTNMEFFLFGDINYIDSDEYYDFNSSQEGELASQHFVENTINVYFFNSAMSGTSPVCGYARFPATGIDRIVMVNDCTTNGSTFPHELGHYFALYHTHGKSNTGTTDELVTREEGSANCESAGDDLCDTEADPNLSGQVDGDCVYTGNATDANGDTFIPNPRNLMSYSQKYCRDEFSQGQADRIVAAYEEYKTYLYDKNYAAIFDVSTKEVCENGTVEFVNESVNAVSYEWTFEGGTPASSTDENPTVTYSSIGNYDVTLVITEADGGTDTKLLENHITVKSEVTSEITTKSGSFEEAELAEAIYNDDEGYTWEKTDAAFTEGANSVFMNFYSYDNSGAEDYLVIAALNTSVEKVFALTFDYAYAPYDASYYDGLEVIYRNPCGQWQTAWSKEGSELATVANQESAFTPTSGQWKSETVVFEVDESDDVIEFAFKAINGYGNNLYIDNYSLDVFDPSFSIESVVVSNASCPDNEDGSVSIDALGDGSFEYSIDGETFIDSNVIENLAPGTYTVTVRNVLGNEETQEVEVGFENDYPEPVIELLDGQLSVVVEDGQTFQWYFEGLEISGATESNLDFENVGSYTVEVSNGACTTLSDIFIVLSSDAFDSNLEIYPNPTSDYIGINLPFHLRKEVERVTINDLLGRKIGVYELSDKLDVRTLEAGLYIIRFELEGEKVYRRFLKQ